jgi:hypothetical protein
LPKALLFGHVGVVFRLEASGLDGLYLLRPLRCCRTTVEKRLIFVAQGSGCSCVVVRRCRVRWGACVVDRTDVLIVLILDDASALRKARARS